MRIVARALIAAVVVSTFAACQQDDGDSVEAAPATPSAAAPSGSAPTPTATDVPAGPVTALFFGDSYFVGGGYTDASNSMADLAARELGWTPIVRGAGGTGFVTGNEEYGLENFIGQIRDGALDVDDAGAVDWLVVEGGGNDKLEDPALIEERAREVLEEAASRYPEAQLVLIGTLDPTVDDFSDSDGVLDALRIAAEAEGVAFVDAQRWLEGRPELVGPDFDHPTPEGHALAGQKLAGALAALAAG